MDDFQFNERKNKHIQEYKPGEPGFPPRSTIHDVKDEDAPKKDKLSKIIFSAFGFLIVIAIILFLVFGGTNNEPEEKDPTGNGSQVEEPNGDLEDPLPDPDDIIIELPDEPPVIIEPGDDVPPVVDPPAVDPPAVKPPAEPTPPTPPTPSETTHTVKAGETLFSISNKYYGAGYVVQLAAYNDIEDPAYLIIGTNLKIPSKELLN